MEVVGGDVFAAAASAGDAGLAQLLRPLAGLLRVVGEGEQGSGEGAGRVGGVDGAVGGGGSWGGVAVGPATPR